MKFTWAGGPTFVLELGPFRIVGDPVLADRFELEGIGEVRRLTPRPAADLSGADIVLVTSYRCDHWDADAVAACAPGRAVAPATEPAPAGTRTLPWGDSVRVEKAGASLAVSAVPAGAPAWPESERGNGYFLRLQRGASTFSVYVTGDSTFSADTREIQRAHGYSNLLVLHVGAESARDGSARSADAKDAMQIVYRMQPNAIAAIHHTTFSHYREPIEPLLEKMAVTLYEKRLRVLREGESFEKSTGPGE